MTVKKKRRGMRVSDGMVLGREIAMEDYIHLENVDRMFDLKKGYAESFDSNVLHGALSVQFVNEAALAAGFRLCGVGEVSDMGMAEFSAGPRQVAEWIENEDGYELGAPYVIINQLLFETFKKLMGLYNHDLRTFGEEPELNTARAVWCGGVDGVFTVDKCGAATLKIAAKLGNVPLPKHAQNQLADGDVCD